MARIPVRSLKPINSCERLDELITAANAAYTEALSRNILQEPTPHAFRFVILRIHACEETARALAESALTELRQRYPDQITLLRRTLLAVEGLVGYLIGGEIERQERFVVASDDSSLSYNEWSSL